jgi:hypothetical protein
MTTNGQKPLIQCAFQLIRLAVLLNFSLSREIKFQRNYNGISDKISDTIKTAVLITRVVFRKASKKCNKTTISFEDTFFIIPSSQPEYVSSNIFKYQD